MEPITSFQNPRYKNAVRLHSSRGRQKQNRIIVFGHREVERATNAGLVFAEIMVNDELLTTELRIRLNTMLSQQSGAVKTKMFNLNKSLFSKLVYGERTVELVGVAERPETSLANIKPSENSMLVVLESIEKPGNLGAIARTADASGASGLLIADATTDIFHPNAIRSSVSTVFSIPVACGRSDEIRSWLSAHDYAMINATPEADQTIFETDLTGRVAIVFGNEARGLSDGWRTQQPMGVRLPMLGNADSLNVSVTASVIMYERRRQLEAGSNTR